MNLSSLHGKLLITFTVSTWLLIMFPLTNLIAVISWVIPVYATCIQFCKSLSFKINNCQYHLLHSFQNLYVNSMNSVQSRWYIPLVTIAVPNNIKAVSKLLLVMFLEKMYQVKVENCKSNFSISKPSWTCCCVSGYNLQGSWILYTTYLALTAVLRRAYLRTACLTPFK